MRTFVFLALVFLSLASQGQIDFHLKTLIQTGYAVDTVVQLLIALDRTTGSNLQTLIDNWAVTEAALLENIGNLQDLTAAQHQHCADIGATINDIENEIARYRDYISQAEDKVASNIETLAGRLQARCTANLLFVQKLKANQDSTRLLEFLRATVSDPGFKAYLDGNNGAFVELKQHMGTNKRNMLSLIAKHHMMSMLQQYTGEDNLNYNLNGRSDEEIGSGHVDNDQSALDLDSFTIDARNLDNFIAELLGHIDELIGYLHQENASLQTVEFNAVQSLIEYQDQVEHENTVLATYVNLWIGHVGDLEELLEQDQEAFEQCEDRADELDESLASAIADYGDRRNNFNERRTSLENTLNALEEVIRVYVEKVVSASEVYKQRIDDELAKSRPQEPSTVEPVSVSVSSYSAAAAANSRSAPSQSWSAETESVQFSNHVSVGSAEVAWINSQGTVSVATISAGDHWSAGAGEWVSSSSSSASAEETIELRSSVQWVEPESAAQSFSAHIVGGNSGTWAPQPEYSIRVASSISASTEESAEEESAEEESAEEEESTESWTAVSAVSASESTEESSSGASELLNWTPSASVPAWSAPASESTESVLIVGADSGTWAPVWSGASESESTETVAESEATVAWESESSWSEEPLTGTPEFSAPSWSAPTVSIQLESESTESEVSAPAPSSSSSTVEGGIEIPTYHAPTVVESSATTLQWSEPSNNWNPPTVPSSEWVAVSSSTESSTAEEEEEETSYSVPSISFKLPEMPEPLWTGASGTVSASQFVETETSWSVPTVTFEETESISVHWVEQSAVVSVAPQPAAAPESSSSSTEEDESSESTSTVEAAPLSEESESESVTLAWSEAVAAVASESSSAEEEEEESESSSGEESWAAGSFTFNDETFEETA